MITELLLRQLKQDGCYIQFIQEATEEMQLNRTGFVGESIF